MHMRGQRRDEPRRLPDRTTARANGSPEAARGAADEGAAQRWGPVDGVVHRCVSRPVSPWSSCALCALRCAALCFGPKRNGWIRRPSLVAPPSPRSLSPMGSGSSRQEHRVRNAQHTTTPRGGTVTVARAASLTHRPPPCVCVFRSPPLTSSCSTIHSTQQTATMRTAQAGQEDSG